MLTIAPHPVEEKTTPRSNGVLGDEERGKGLGRLGPAGANENAPERTPHSSSRYNSSPLMPRGNGNSKASSSSSRLAVARIAPLRRNLDASPVLRRSLSGTASSSSSTIDLLGIMVGFAESELCRR